MNLILFNIFCPSLKDTTQLKERVDMSKFNENEEIYVIPMHRKGFGTNKWMQEPRFFFADYRSNTMILGEVRNTKEVGEHLREKEDRYFVIIAEV
jgi:hypothetical protein